MSKTTGYSQYVCDRCGKSIYTLDTAPEAQTWRTIQRITADGVMQSNLLCPECSGKYRTFSVAQDVAFGDFMAKKEA